jgi:hypothetical protein
MGASNQAATETECSQFILFHNSKMQYVAIRAGSLGKKRVEVLQLEEVNLNAFRHHNNLSHHLHM